MNKIFYWTFGSIFRTLGRIITYLLIGGLITLICVKNDIKITQLLGFEVVNAKTFTTTENYRVRLCQAQCACDCEYNSWTSNGTSTSIASSKIPDGLSMNFGTNDVFYSGVTYRVEVSFDYTGSLHYANNPYNFSCFGGTTNSTSGGDESNIQTCQAVGNIIGNNNITFVYDLTPLVDIKSIKINTYFSAESWSSVKGNTSKSKVTIDTSTSDAINNQTTNIINNNNQNTQDIINNQNQLLGNACTNLFNENFVMGDITGQNTSIRARSSQTIYLSSGTYYFRTNISSGYNYALSTQGNVPPLSTWPTWSYDTGWITLNYKEFIVNTPGYFTISFRKSDNTSFTLSEITQFNWMLSKDNKPYCKYGSFTSKQDETTNAVNDLNNSINNDDSTEAQNKASTFFSNFTTNTHGLTGIITAPLNAINSLSSSTCSPLVLPLPFVNQNLTLPCMRQIYVDNFGAFMIIYDVITLGIISYWIMVRIFTLVKDFKNPDHDEIEVLDL